MLFNAEAANDVPEFKFRAEISRGTNACFSGVGKTAVSCSGCVPAGSCKPGPSGQPKPDKTKPDRPPVDPTVAPSSDTSLGGTLVIAVGVVVVAVVVLAAVVGIIFFVRRRGPPVPRGRDYFPKLDDDDSGSGLTH